MKPALVKATPITPAAPLAAPSAPPSDAAKDASSVAIVDQKIAAGEAEQALELARTLKDDGSAASAAAWVRAAFAAGKLAEAHDACGAWIARHADKKALEPRLADARALRGLGRLDEAKARLEEAVALHPESQEAKTMLKDLELLRGASVKPAPARHLKKKKAPQKLLG
jgi:tetratricopeptide (TPR) repeat protein